MNRRIPNPKNLVESHVESAVVQYATDEPAHGQLRVSNELRKKGIFVSLSGVRSIWLILPRFHGHPVKRIYSYIEVTNDRKERCEEIP